MEKFAMPDPIRLMIADTTSGKYPERVKDYSQGMPFDLIYPEGGGEESKKAAAREAEAILCYKTELSGEVIKSAPSLKFIQKHGLSLKNIDMAAAREMGAQVATMPLMRNASVAEHALTLMLCCIRKAIPGHKAVTEAAYLDLGVEPIVTSQWDMKTNWTGIEGISELFGASVGIVGLGDIGMDIVTRCRAFNMEVFYYQRTPHLKEVEKAFDATYLPLEKLLAEVDFVVLIIPHTPKTEGIIGARELARMKPTAILINVGRGGLVDEDALAEALRSGVIAMAGLDVYRREPLPESNPLRLLPNVVLFPHTGGGSNRSWGVDVPAVLENILKFFRGETPKGVIS
jgi:lactate dehydrogenase-like 2-hydroxyacid dehydrogenase